MACSVIIGLMLLKQVSLTRELYDQEHDLGDSEEVASAANAYDNAWKQLAIRIFETGRNDPDLMDVLKAQGIGIREGKSGETSPADTMSPAPAPAPAPPAPGH